MTLILLLLILLVLFFVLATALASVYSIGPTQIGLVRKRIGKKLPGNNPVAFAGEAGYQAELLMPGLRFKFKPFFAVTPRNNKAVTDAIGIAMKECLPDPQVRKRWIRSLNQAMSFMLSFDGEPATIANGRMLEFRFLIIALQRYTE